MNFIFTTCQIGAENALKDELKWAHPELRLAYSRPGFLTFKSPESLPPNFSLNSVFAREYGLSYKKVSTPDEVAKLLQELTQNDPENILIHAYDVDTYFPGNEPDHYIWNEHSSACLKSIGKKNSTTRAKPSQTVIDVVAVSDHEFWVGSHTHTEFHTGFVGGRPELKLPEAAPSRAYLKFEEARLVSGFDLKAGDTALEIGSTPGGAAFRLLELGLKYVGIDPKLMHPVFAKYGSHFRHLRNESKGVGPDAFPNPVHWLLLDANIPPDESLPEIERVMKILTSKPDHKLKGIYFTIKLNDWAFAKEIPSHIERIRKMPVNGIFRSLKAKQLAYNRQEYLVYGYL